MYFIFRGKVIEISKLKLILFFSILFFIILTSLSFYYFREFLLLFTIITLILITFLTVYSLIPTYYFFEFKNVLKEKLKYVIISLTIISLISIIIAVPMNLNISDAVGLSTFINLTKKPTVELPSDFNDDETILTTTTLPATTTTIPITTTTTVSTTTTTRIQTYHDQKGFFVTQSERTKDDQPKDCSFNGRGHDAVLMPSGNYYCRSTEQRVTIYVEGVEKICCVTP